MLDIGLVSFRSEMSEHDPSLETEKEEFLKAINEDEAFNFVEHKEGLLNVFFIETGGSEVFFKAQYQKGKGPYYFLVRGERNSLASSLEILSFLHEQGEEGEILQGDYSYIHDRLLEVAKFFVCRKEMAKANFARIGAPSDWLIASGVDKDELKRIYGANLIDIPMDELKKEYLKAEVPSSLFDKYKAKTDREHDLIESLKIYLALKVLINKYDLKGFTLRCFDLVTSYKQTSCLAFGMLNEEGIISGCEGDVPSMLSMYMCKLLFGQSSFMANPALISPKERKAIYAHCTCPIDMLTSYKLDTHFESGLGFAIKGEFKEGEITMMKIHPDLKRIRAIEGVIEANLDVRNRCRSQIQVKFDEDINCLIDEPYGNHMIFIYGRHKEELQRFFEYLIKE